MGFLDKVKGAVDRIKEDNKYMARTTARINSGNLFGWVNYKTGKMDPNDDFRAGSYINVENDKGIIYNTGDEDYFVEPGDIVSFEKLGAGQPINNKDVGTRVDTIRFAVEFKDGKKTTMDIDALKVPVFKSIFNL